MSCVNGAGVLARNPSRGMHGAHRTLEINVTPAEKRKKQKYSSSSEWRGAEVSKNGWQKIYIINEC